MESFPRYLAIVRKRGPQPFWTPVAPLHRIVSYPLSYLYCAARLTPLTVTLLGLALALAGAGLLMASGLGSAPFLAGLALLNLGVIHDACDGEVARYRIHHGLQSPHTYRVGMFADFWAFAVVVQALLPLTLGLVAWRAGAPWPLASLGACAAFTLLASYVAGFGRAAYWPGKVGGAAPESFSFARGGGPLLRLLRRGYFYAFETAMFTTHATAVLVGWGVVGGLPPWAVAYAGAVAGAILAAFLVATATALRGFDRVAP